MPNIKLGVWLPGSIDCDRFDNTDTLEGLCLLLHSYPKGTRVILFLNTNPDKIDYGQYTEFTIGDCTLYEKISKLYDVVNQEAAKFLTDEQKEVVSQAVVKTLEELEPDAELYGRING